MAHGGHPTKSVVIIGAGIGGTSCAHYLSKQDPVDKITIFEAQDDVGESLLMAPDTFGSCQRPVFSLSVSQHNA